MASGRLKEMQVLGGRYSSSGSSRPPRDPRGRVAQRRGVSGAFLAPRRVYPACVLVVDQGETFRRLPFRSGVRGRNDCWERSHTTNRHVSSKRVGCGERSEPHRSRTPRLMRLPANRGFTASYGNPTPTGPGTFRGKTDMGGNGGSAGIVTCRRSRADRRACPQVVYKSHICTSHL